MLQQICWPQWWESVWRGWSFGVLCSTLWCSQNRFGVRRRARNRTKIVATGRRGICSGLFMLCSSPSSAFPHFFLWLQHPITNASHPQTNSLCVFFQTLSIPKERDLVRQSVWLVWLSLRSSWLTSSCPGRMGWPLWTITFITSHSQLQVEF